jgi:hypothetical protein
LGGFCWYVVGSHISGRCDGGPKLDGFISLVRVAHPRWRRSPLAATSASLPRSQLCSPPPKHREQLVGMPTPPDICPSLGAVLRLAPHSAPRLVCQGFKEGPAAEDLHLHRCISCSIWAVRIWILPVGTRF